MKKMALFLVALGVFGIASALQAGEMTDNVVKQSRYYGVGWQRDGSHWSIELLFFKDGAQVAYPSIECSGEWTFLGEFPGSLDYAEHISDGVDNCISDGKVRIQPLKDGRLAYTWYENPPTIDARAVLMPLRGKRLSYMNQLKETLNGVQINYMNPEFDQ